MSIFWSVTASCEIHSPQQGAVRKNCICPLSCRSFLEIENRQSAPYIWQITVRGHGHVHQHQRTTQPGVASQCAQKQRPNVGSGCKMQVNGKWQMVNTEYRIQNAECNMHLASRKSNSAAVCGCGCGASVIGLSLSSIDHRLSTPFILIFLLSL